MSPYAVELNFANQGYKEEEEELPHPRGHRRPSVRTQKFFE